ncbi:hypothetical protein [Comamonas sp.]|uniref:hypothetical protein n=1 Tax=Comamonas sp. TaxID=34028 RepID=UPI0025C31A44|nr:hypothetical protein [Comamonas sp.]
MHNYQVGDKVFFPVHTTDSEVEWCEGKIQNYRQDIKNLTWVVLVIGDGSAVKN